MHRLFLKVLRNNLIVSIIAMVCTSSAIGYTQHNLNYNGATIIYRIYGQPNSNYPILLLHGGFSSLDD